MHNHPTPKFSIITVTYNAEAVLEDTIQSVISQTYHHVEYILVDGASKDGTLSIIDRYRDRITRIVSEPELVDKEGHFIRMRRLAAPEVLTWRSFKQGMLVCHQAFFAKASLVEPYDLQYRFSADFDWCIRVMKKARALHNTHLTLIDYLEEGMTTQNRQASLRERFRIMARHYGLASTIAHHAWFVLRAVIKK